MPEMPEVEIIRRSLDKSLAGRTVMKVDIILPRQIKWPDTETFRALLTGHKFSRAERVGKFLILVMDNGAELVVHLRMTGHLAYHASKDDGDKYARIRFLLDNGAVLTYGDARTLGAVYALKKGERQRIKALAEMGAEPLSEEFTAEYLKNVCAGRKITIKQLILEQKSVGGVGNIYADEALFAAKIFPGKQAAELTDCELTRLRDAINKVIAAGIEDGGTTFRDYQNAEGKKGNHQENLFVYARNGQKCRLCGETIKKITVGGRGTHFCPRCQGEA